MPFKSKSQQRFMFTKHPGIAKEFAAATPNISALPEHVKMADGGMTDPNIPGLPGVPELLGVPRKDITKYADGGISDADERSPDYPNAKMTGMPPEVLSALMGGLMGGMSPITTAKEVGPALEGLGETGEITIGKAAPKMEEAVETASTPKVEPFIKGIQKSPNGNEIKIWGVRGDPDEIAKLGYGSDPGSVPEHILRQKGILPESIDAAGQNAPNTYSNGGFIDKLKGDKTDAQKADDIDPVITPPSASTDTPKGYADGGFPHVTFMEDQTPEEVKKTTHMEKAPKMADGGIIHKAKNRDKEPAKPKDIEMSHERKLSSIYKAMGIKQYADGGMADATSTQPSTPTPSDPTYWDQIKAALSQVTAPITGAVNAATTPLQATTNMAMPLVPPAMSAINKLTGTNLPIPILPSETPATAPAIPPSSRIPAALPVSVSPMPASAARPTTNAPSGMPNLSTLFNQDTSGLTQGVNPEDRQALANQLQTQQHGLGAIIGHAVAGLGDALAAKGGKEQHSLQNIFSMEKAQRDEAMANFDKARQDRVQKLQLQTQMGDNALKQAAAADAYSTDEHLNSMIGAPKGTMKKDLPTYFSLMSAQVAKQEKDADLYMKSHLQASTDLDNAVKNSSVLGIKPSAAQLQASGARLADQYFNRARGNILVKPSDGGPSQWIPAQNIAKAKQIDPNLQVQP